MKPRRIGIIGAGASGLAAADALRRLGHQDVTVLERGDRVGGKCRTFFHEGRSYELGAGAFTRAYRNVGALMEEHDVHASPGVGGLLVDLETRRWGLVPPSVRDLPFHRLGAAGVRLAAALWRERGLQRPGFAGISRELHAPFSEWARARRLDGVAALIEPWFTGFGYGYLDEVPAAYVLKYLALFRVPVGELLTTGYQGLWERVAARLDVRLGVQIHRIARGDEVVVDAGAERFVFDALIVTCPPEDALGILDGSDEERELFTSVRTNDYHVIAADVERAPRVRYGFFPEHLRRERAGHAVFWYRRWSDRDLVLYYCLPAPGTTLDASAEIVGADVSRAGGRIRRIHRLHAWRYFPHVGTADMNAGYYDRLEAMQGRRRTFFAGELLAFSTVETVVAYARHLVARHFAPDRPPR